jgi:hypothetical protein
MRVRLALLLLCLLCAFALCGDARQDSVRVTMTAYSPGDSGRITASGVRAQPGMLAVSRDVERLMGLRFGEWLLVGGRRVQFMDRMARRWHLRIDLRVATYAQAVQFGRHEGVLLVREQPVVAPLTALPERLVVRDPL